MAMFRLRRIGLKLLSVGVAALAWFLISGQQLAERALRIPLEFTNLSRELEMTDEPPTVVDVRVRGSSAALSRVAPGELIAVLDLQSARPGRRLFHITGSDVRTPFGLEVIQVTPANLAMNFEVSASKVLPVAPVVEGEPAAGFAVRTVSSNPASVEVVGPESVLKRISEAITEPISVAGVSALVRETVSIGLPDPAVRLRTPQSALVTVDISPSLARTVLDLPISPRGEKSRAAVLKPSTVSALVRGPREVVDSLRGADLDASVDVEGLGVGDYRLGVRVNAPNHITVVEVEPAQVQVTVR